MARGISADRLRELLHYCPSTGVFRFLNHSIKTRIGSETGRKNKDGYLVILVEKNLYMAHRLAWLYVTGGDPGGQIDHMNRDRTDNRFENLRDVPQSVNMQNIVDPKKNATSGYRGVSVCSRGFEARIQVNKKSHFLGRFKDPETAFAAYMSAKKLMHKEAYLSP